MSSCHHRTLSKEEQENVEEVYQGLHNELS